MDSIVKLVMEYDPGFFSENFNTKGTGVLFGPNYILTAAHTLYNTPV